jgi:hypothetical protein
MKYTLETMYCNCHPKTCCCPKYAIMLGMDIVMSTDDYVRAEGFCGMLNKGMYE